MNTRLQDIQTLIDKANDAYYTLGKEIMDDSRYDKLKSELKLLNPTDPRLQSVGASVRSTILQKKSHTIPMGSQDKAMNEAEFYAWVKTNKLENTTLHGSHKMDGASLSLEYKNGKLISAITRGDGLIGEDITANAIKFKNIPQNCIRPDGKVFSGFVRGEIILSVADWKDIDPLSNPRNLAGGIARRKNGSDSEYLKVYAFRMFDDGGDLLNDFEQDMSDYLIKMGFDIAPYVTGKPDEIWAWYNKVHKERPNLSYWIDGLVIKVNDLDKQTGMGDSSANCPRGQIAIKFPAEGKVTTLRNVTWQVGASGTIAPVANFDTVQIGGTNVSNATLCNMEYIETNDIHINDKIFVVKAGDIIPRVMEVSTKATNRIEITKPTKCPCCSGKVGHKNNIGGDDSTALYCLNDKCFAVVCGKIERYVKSLDIQGIGSNVIESLVKDLGIETPADLYKLSARKNEIANLTLSGGGRFGESRTDKILEEIEKKKELTLSDFLGSLGINGLGKRRVILIQKAVPGLLDTLDDWLTIKLEIHASQAGVPNLGQSINFEILSQENMIKQFIANGVVIKPPQAKKQAKPGAKIFCITGKMPRKKEYYYDLIEQKGHVGTDTFSKDINYLIAADKNSGSVKLQKATKYNIPIIDENDLMNILQS